MSKRNGTFHPHAMWARGRRLAGAGLAAACLFVLLAASPALGAAAWSITSEHGPENFEPNGRGQYLLQAYNIGDSDTNSSYTISISLPDGVTATSVGGDARWSCPDLVSRPIVCRHRSLGPDRVRPPGTTSLRDAVFRGRAHELLLNVDVGGAVSGTADTEITIQGGGAASPVTIRDPITFTDTPASFGFSPKWFLMDAFDAPAPTGGEGGAPVRQAGSHPYEMRVNFGVNSNLGSDFTVGDYLEPFDSIKTLETRLPAGTIGNPQATPQCTALDFSGGGHGNKGGDCAANTQVGSADLVLQEGTGTLQFEDVPVYNMVPPRGVVAAFAMIVLSRPVWIYASVDPADNYAIVATVEATPGTAAPRHVALSLWGVPGDPAHDLLRQDPDASIATFAMNTPFTGDIKPFLTLPSQCDVPDAASLRADSWGDPGAFAPAMVGTVAQMTGCDDARFRFEPTISVRPEALTPSTPTGLDVNIIVPQKDDTVLDATDLYAQNGRDVAINTPPVRDVKVALPEGMSVSPSSADGLGACTPAQIGLGTNDQPSCPDASKIGTVSVDTPLLPDPLTGDVFFATQNDNPFGTTLAIYIVASGPGVIIKLPGKIEPNPVTGQLTATFADNPQLPFSHMNVHFNSGPRAPLVTPPTCGMKTASAEMTSWNSSVPAAVSDSSFEISGDGAGAPCAPRGFNPGFSAGTIDSTAGKDSPLVTRFTRSDADDELSTIDVSMPKGLLGRIADVVLCADAAANAGACGEGSRIGTAVVGAGPGSNPFFITNGRVHMTGPYKGAPFGLSIVVHAKAGPIDLGNVIVRAAVHVDKLTAQLRVVSDPMPRILEGIPLLVRVVDITVDKPGFTFNPTSCSETDASATLRSTGGLTSSKSVRFQAGDCADLPFEPRMKIRVGGRRRTQRGRSTPLTAAVRMAPGQANLRGVRVTLPTTINARLPVINEACTRDEFEAGNCEEARAGTAVAVTPLLRDPLRGNVYFVRNGNPLPDVMVALRGQVDFDLIGRVSIPGSKRLRTHFDTVPDVPITKFALRFVAGRNGPVGNAANLCEPVSRRMRMGVSFVAQNGKAVHRSQRLGIRGCKKSKRAKAQAKRKAARKSTGGTAGTR